MTTNSAPLVSVIVPVYGVEAYLRRCVESVLAQTYREIEVWLVDDGSPDRCGEMCDEFAAQDVRVHVVHKENGGLGDARNVAIDVCTGEWITFIDSDDCVAPDYVETLVGLVLSYNCTLAEVGFLTFAGAEEPKAQSGGETTFVDEAQALENMLYMRGLVYGSAWGKLYHKTLFGNDVRFPKGFLYEDVPVTFVSVHLAGGVAVSKDRKYFYYNRPGSILNSEFSQKKFDSALYVVQRLESLKDMGRKAEKAFKCRVLSMACLGLLNSKNNSEHEAYLWNKVKEYRWTVLADWKTRPKARVACALSLLGLSALKWAYRKFNK